jgi:heterodisulfide reductase subunit A
LNIELLTLTDVERVEGELGRFTVTLRQRPRYVDMEKCIACGECALKCPKKTYDRYNEGIGSRKAIYVRYPQAVPLKYQIDPEQCIKLVKGKCGACEKVCPAGAINFDDKEKELTIQVGSMILAPGFQVFNPTGIRTWGYKIFPNVITAMELERYLSASGPTEGHLIRPSDGKGVKKIAFLQCVGSRDYNKASHGYCSSACCMFAIKEAMVAMDHVKDLEVSVFYMDMRTHGKEFERYYERAKEKGIKFHRCRVHSLEPAGEDGTLYFRYITDEGKQVKDMFDLVVLSVGMESHAAGVKLAGCAGVDLNHNKFAVTSSFSPVNSSRPGIYVCGTFSGPKDIPQSVMEASAAASAASIPLSDARFSLSRRKECPPERDVLGEEPRIGVFICHCGSNIAGVIDVEAVAAYAETLPHVAYVERNLFTCAQDTQEIIRQRIQEKGLNRLVVAACTPRTHESLFRETLKASGLNEYLFDMANIRNHASWVHQEEPEAATAKARDMVRMSVAKVGLLEPLAPVSVGVNPQALVIGGGVAGMVSALGLADQGFPVHLVEKSSQLGGNARHLYKTWNGESIQEYVEDLVGRVKKHELITVHLKARISQAEGYVGNFRSTISHDGGATTVEHGAAVVATGGQAFKPAEYGYSQSQRVLTALEFDKLHLVGDERVKDGRNFVFIQCVGSRQPERQYCSRVCCTHSVQAAIALKEEDPNRNVFILYRDIRTFGQREELYTKARELGVIFIDYEAHGKPDVRIGANGRLDVVVWDHVLHEPFKIGADLVVLATAIVPNPDSADLAKIYKLSKDMDGFFHEAHAKLRPVDFATDGIFMAGLAHYPKPIEEVAAQAQAAVSRAVTVLSSRVINLDSIKARVSAERCDGCALCLDVCPYHAISLVDVDGADNAGGGAGDGKRRVAVNVAKCKGCGVCQATCPKEGVAVGGFSYKQLSAQVEAALNVR